jgi:hypothetical protein
MGDDIVDKGYIWCDTFRNLLYSTLTAFVSDNDDGGWESCCITANMFLNNIIKIEKRLSNLLLDGEEF